MSKYTGPTLKPVDLADMLQSAGERAARPRMQPREVFAQTVQNIMAGLGAGAIGALIAFWFGLAWTLEIALTVAVAVAGALMLWRGAADEIYDMRKLREFKRTAERLAAAAQLRQVDAEKRLSLALDALDDLERAHDQIKRDLDTERILRAQLQERVNAQPRYNSASTFTTARADAEPQGARDAREIMRRFYGGGGYLSRPKAEEIGWTQERQATAFQLLKDAGILHQNHKQVRFVPPTLADAEKQLSDHLIRLKTQVEPLHDEREN